MSIRKFTGVVRQVYDRRLVLGCSDESIAKLQNMDESYHEKEKKKIETRKYLSGDSLDKPTKYTNPLTDSKSVNICYMPTSECPKQYYETFNNKRVTVWCTFRIHNFYSPPIEKQIKGWHLRLKKIQESY
jgi:hypothetical protein